jgi:hypothetical protein
MGACLNRRTQMPDVIEVDVTTTRCAPLSTQLARMSTAELRDCADSLRVRGAALTKVELAAAVAAAIVVAKR